MLNISKFLYLEKYIPMLRFFFLLMAASALGQKPDFSVAAIPQTLSDNANAVVREELNVISISGRRSMIIKRHRVITVLNKLGLEHLNAVESGNVRSIEATILDANSNEIKRFKRKDFKMQNTAGATEVTDDHILYLDFTPTSYPFTLVYDSEVGSSNTAFIPPWFPIDDYLISIEKSVVKVTCPDDLGFSFKAYNTDAYRIAAEQSAGSVTFRAENLPALKQEAMAPSIRKVAPLVSFAVRKFHLEGVDGDATDWTAFGLWTYNNLLSGTDALPDATKAKIRALVGSETDPLKKAAIVYKFVQDYTRYVSIQLGIGGWKPMKASSVDRLGYGDCKALTNYTRALLAAVDVPSYYTLLYSNDYKTDLEQEIVSQQGNHAMLALPHDGKITLLECTSQTAPFGLVGTHFDDRHVLMVTPEGGKMIRTESYAPEQSVQSSEGSYTIDTAGKLTGNVVMVSTGIQYNNRLQLDRKTPEETDVYYKEYFSNISSASIRKSKKQNDIAALQYREELEIAGDRYADVVANRMMFPVNAFNNSRFVPQRYRSRSLPLEILRGYVDVDEVLVNFPDGFSIEAKPDDVVISGKFGEYATQIEIVGPSQVRYHRRIKINPGHYTAAEYDEYRKFREQIARNDNAKIVLNKTQ